MSKGEFGTREVVKTYRWIGAFYGALLIYVGICIGEDTTGAFHSGNLSDSLGMHTEYN